LIEEIQKSGKHEELSKHYGCGDMEYASGSFEGAVGGGIGLLELQQNPAAIPQVLGADFGEGHPPSGAMEQPRPQSFFQVQRWPELPPAERDRIDGPLR